MTPPGTNGDHAFTLAKERYAEWGVDVESALRRLSAIAISLHCWQGDDVGGFEDTGQELGGGLAVTGNYPGKARTAEELRSDLDKTFSLLPGTHRLNLHASYAETGGRKVERDALRARALPRLDRLGEGPSDRDGLQPDILRPSAGRRRLHAGPSRREDPPILDRSRDRLPADRRRDRPGSWAIRASRTSGSPTAPRSCPSIAGARAIGWPRPSTRSSPSRSTRSTTATPSKGSSSESARRATSSARTSSIWVTPSRGRSCSASTPATIIRPRSSPTRSRPCSSTSTRSCCT